MRPNVERAWLAAAYVVLLPISSIPAQEPRLRTKLKGHTGDVASLAYSPNGKTLASGGLDFTVKLWDVAAAKERATLKGHTNSVRSVAYSPDGTILASASDDETIKLWDGQTGRLIAT